MMHLVERGALLGSTWRYRGTPEKIFLKAGGDGRSPLTINHALGTKGLRFMTGRVNLETARLSMLYSREGSADARDIRRKSRIMTEK